MTGESPARPTNGDIFQRLDRIEDKLDQRLESLDVKVDGAISRLDRLEGGLSLVKWIGPAGVAGVLIGFAKVQGWV